MKIATSQSPSLRDKYQIHAASFCRCFGHKKERWRRCKLLIISWVISKQGHACFKQGCLYFDPCFLFRLSLFFVAVPFYVLHFLLLSIWMVTVKNAYGTNPQWTKVRANKCSEITHTSRRKTCIQAMMQPSYFGFAWGMKTYPFQRGIDEWFM